MTVNAYEMLFTDGNPNREFIIQPYTRNGPATPTTGVDPTAATANTTLFLYGKGTPDYGERIQEDMVYMLEHFNNPVEPSFPIPGQIWSNTSVSPPQLYVFNTFKYTVVSNTTNTIAIQPTNSLDSLASVQARFLALFTATKPFAVYAPSFAATLTYTQTAAPTIGGGMVILSVTPATPLSSMLGYTIGGWESILQSNTVNILRASLNANGQAITNVPTPVNPGDAVNKAYADAAAGGVTSFNTRTGAVTLTSGDVTTALTYTPVNKAGDTMTGLLVLSGPPTAALGAATKAYVDNEPLSSAVVTITSPASGNLLVYNAGTLKWINTTPLGAGVLPLTGGALTGPLTTSSTIDLGGNKVTSVATPTVPTDAATKGYVDSLIVGAGGITSATYDPNAGVLVINQTASPPIVTVTGFLPVSSQNVTYVPPDPASIGPVPGLLFQSTLSDVFSPTGNSLQDPTNLIVQAALSQVDLALGNYVVPRQRIVMTADGVHTAYNLKTGTPNTLVGTAPGLVYVAGSGNLQIYDNGVKQIPSDHGFYKMTNITTTSTYTATLGTGTSTLTVPGDLTKVLRVQNQFTISGTSTVNDGSYVVTAVGFSVGITTVTTTPNLTAPVPGTSTFVASPTGTLTYGPFGIMPAMQTGFSFGSGSNPVALDVSVNGATGVALSFDTNTTNCNTFGLLCDSVNSMVAAFYINPVTAVIAGVGGSFTVAGNRVTQFTGATFTVRYSTGNNGTYTVFGIPTFAAGQTTIIVSGTVPSTTPDGIIFQDNWGYTMAIEGGTIVFYSNVGGAGSSVVPQSGTLLTQITGVDWPVVVTGAFTGATNAFTCQDYAYKEIGLHGYPSSLVEFTVAPAAPDILEIIIDYQMTRGEFNPTFAAVTA